MGGRKETKGTMRSKEIKSERNNKRTKRMKETMRGGKETNEDESHNGRTKSNERNKRRMKRNERNNRRTKGNEKNNGRAIGNEETMEDQKGTKEIETMENK
jgi:hypothetical protein